MKNSGTAPRHVAAVVLTSAALSLVVVREALPATSGTSDVILAATATTEIQITDASVTLTPNQANYEAGFVVAEGASGIAVQVRSNSSTGMILSIKSVDGTPGIALADLAFKTQTAAGTGGATISSYTTITGSDQSLWTTTDTQPDWQVVDTDIRVSNLWEYPDDAGGGTTDYTTTLTYTVTVQ
ncbi:MAG: hypothetical protein IPK72_06570 [Candidatus Eisenbacteria bacterium]|nr:hypothetical protein [Candidatus Eisenbacteria bacterium]